MDNFGIRRLMAWNKLKNGELAIMDNDGNWHSYRVHPLFAVLQGLKQDEEFFPEMSKGYRLMQLLLRQGYILVNAEDY